MKQKTSIKKVVPYIPALLMLGGLACLGMAVFVRSGPYGSQSVLSVPVQFPPASPFWTHNRELTSPNLF